MEMTPGQSEKLKRYLINADRFLWDVLKAKNKKNRMKELKELGFFEIYPEKNNPTYSKINQDLLIELGIEKEFLKRSLKSSGCLIQWQSPGLFPALLGAGADSGYVVSEERETLPTQIFRIR